MKYPLLLLLPVLFAVGCSDPVAPKPPVPKVAKTKEQRIAWVTKFLSKSNVLPTRLIDAQFEEVVVGGDHGGFGPSDYVSYLYFKVEPDEMDKWDPLLVTKMGYSSLSHQPKKYPWWLDDKDEKELEFFEPSPLASRNGWIAVSRKTGEVWILGFTT